MNDLNKPKEIYSNLIWDTYKFLVGLEKPYIYKISRHQQGRRTYCDGEILYKITDIQIDHGETEWASYSIGDLPCVRDEWVKLELEYFYEGKIQKIEKEICVNAYNEENMSVNDLLTRYNLRLPTDDELNYSKYEGDIPVFRDDESFIKEVIYFCDYHCLTEATEWFGITYCTLAAWFQKRFNENKSINELIEKTRRLERKNEELWNVNYSLEHMLAERVKSED